MRRSKATFCVAGWHLPAVLLPMCAMWCFAVGSLLQGDDQKLSSAKAAELMAKIPSDIRKIAFGCRMQTSMMRDKTLHVADLFLAWELANDHYYSIEIQYGDGRGTEPKHLVIQSWDGKEQIYWARYVDKNYPGFGMAGTEPLDPGSVILSSKARTGTLGMFQEALFPLRLWGSDKDSLDVMAGPNSVPKTLGFDTGAIFQLKSGASTLLLHNPTGWVVDHQIQFAGQDSLRLQLSDFHPIQASTIMFPAHFERTADFRPAGKYQCEVQIARETIKINDEVTLPVVTWHPRASIQDERSAH
jgi:hypothetical protein